MPLWASIPDLREFLKRKKITRPALIGGAVPRVCPGSESEDWCVSVVQESIANICAQRGFVGLKMDTFNKLKQFDAYPKTLEDFRVKTWGGATGEQL